MSDGLQALDPAKVLLADSFGRIRELVASVTDGLSSQQSTYRPDRDANSIGWLVWHLARVQDDHLSELANVEQAWTLHGWAERFTLPFDGAATGYGQTSQEVADVGVDPALLDRYHDDVHRKSLEYVDSLTPDELSRIVDDSWDPPVTVSVRLVSVIGDCLQHVGQAAYLRGIVER
ncbi:MAG: DUF664 domain-containing protein, partial [Propionibacteriales bacterium]|nr:DUF664 domain-containing protein [Propionibacteriales bacterium]